MTSVTKYKWDITTKIVLISQLIFTIGWIVAGFLQGDKYSIAKYSISELGALNAQYPWVWNYPMIIGGGVVIWFSVGVLRPMLKASGIRWPVGAWLLAFSLMGIGSVSDFFFPLDCSRGADTECIRTILTKVHRIVGVSAFFVTLITPFVLAWHMRKMDKWKDLSSKTILYGICLLIVGLGLLDSTNSYWGYMQRLLCLMGSFGVILLAFRTNKISTNP